jgi:FKBP-type peptidyl-prolyl cis-trans isomerase SlyD
MMEVAANCVVSIRYIMKNDRDEILENTLQGEPTTYLHGGAGILKILQQQLEGLTPGAKKMVLLPGETGLTGSSFTGLNSLVKAMDFSPRL